MRLIDADALKEKILKERDAIPKTYTERYGFGVEFPNHDGESIRCGIRKALRCMEQTPTVDAVPVKHGRWVWDKNATDWGLGGWICSGCQEKNDNIPAKPDIHPSGWVGSHYCPNCGAKMEE